MAKCPICAKVAAPRTKNPSFPFCSPRCKTVDLGKWLNEEYCVPVDDEKAQPEERNAEKEPS
jgi:endogenous inhibitor of DNA gyrase (YacG/DUF329 family)